MTDEELAQLANVATLAGGTTGEAILSLIEENRLLSGCHCVGRNEAEGGGIDARHCSEHAYEAGFTHGRAHAAAGAVMYEVEEDAPAPQNILPPAPQPKTLREIRLACGKSQGALAKAAGMNQGDVSDVERRPDCRVSTLRKLALGMGGVCRVLFEIPGHPTFEFVAPIGETR